MTKQTVSVVGQVVCPLARSIKGREGISVTEFVNDFGFVAVGTARLLRKPCLIRIHVISQTMKQSTAKPADNGK
jgi:hypothetical protein